ncbi:rRNA-binding ribosome biosynthesis protein [Microbotryomycetes sp. JL221]|nr:rRNA-binding ribosome biosynthesis protein [Microbotryomycetes sp. JL221]
MPRKGSKRKKTRTHVKAADPSKDPNAPKVPKSFVVKSGTVGTTVSTLTRDLRKVLEPNTATRLRERKANKLRDYVSMSGPLGVTHLLVLSQPQVHDVEALVDESATTNKHERPEDRADRSLIEGTTTLNLRLIRLPRGPTLSFKVLRYSLAADVLRMARRPRSIGREFAEGPLLILSGFGGEDKQLKLMTTVFQNLFPPIHVQTMPLSSARRVVLLSYNAQTKTVDFRHYLITVRPVGVSKPIRKIVAGSTANKVQSSSTSNLLSRKRALATSDTEQSEEDDDLALSTRSNGGGAGVPGKGKGILDLSRAEDISDYILRHEGMGFVSSDSEMSDNSDAGSQSGGGSDSEADEKRGKVRLAGDYVGRGNRGKSVRGEKRAVRLMELGPRMELGLFKIEEGVGEGEVLYHEMVHKSQREAAELARAHAARRKLAAERRAQQEANVAAKKAANGQVKFADDDNKADADEDDDDDIAEEDKIIDDGWDYDAEHGLPVPGSDEELGEEDSDIEHDDYDGENGAVDSDAEDSMGSDEETIVGPENDDDDDSDLEPIPISEAYKLDEEEEKRPLKKSKPSANKPRQSAMGFSHKGFSKQDRKPAPRALGIALPKGPTKKEVKRQQAEDKKAGVQKGRPRFEDVGEEGHQKQTRGDDGGHRGGRGGGRGGRGGRGGKRRR